VCVHMAFREFVNGAGCAGGGNAISQFVSHVDKGGFEHVRII